MSNRSMAFAVVAALCCAAPAYGADMIKPAPALVPDAGYNWTGFYVGLHGGYGFGSPKTGVRGNDPVTDLLVGADFIPQLGSPDLSGFMGGLQLGYNWQFGRFILGLETDLSYTDFGSSGATIGLPVPADAGGLGLPELQFRNTGSRELEYLGTVRARAGFTLFDEMFVFATGGLAYGGAEIRGSLTAFTPDVAGGTPAALWTGSNSRMLTGYTLGAGTEIALHERVTLKFEYMWYDLGSISLNTPLVLDPGGLVGTSIRQSYDVNGSVVRAGRELPVLMGRSGASAVLVAPTRPTPAPSAA